MSELNSPSGPSEPDPALPERGYPSYHPPGEAPTTPWHPASPTGPSRQSIGVRSFVLALAPLLVTNVASIVLAVLALTRPRDSEDHGRGFAVVALVIDVLVLAAWALVLTLVLD